MVLGLANIKGVNKDFKTFVGRSMTSLYLNIFLACVNLTI